MDVLTLLCKRPSFQDIDRAFGEGYAFGRVDVEERNQAPENPYGSDRDYLGWAWVMGYRMAVMYGQDKRDEAEFIEVQQQRDQLVLDNKALIERIDLANQRAQNDATQLKTFQQQIDQQSSLIHSLSRMLEAFQSECDSQSGHDLIDRTDYV